jgi:hypothetical protein
MEPTAADAEHLLEALQAFSRGLSSEERALLGALVAPAVARAIGAEPEHGSALSVDGTSPLPEVLGDAIRGHPGTLPALGGDAVDGVP